MISHKTLSLSLLLAASISLPACSPATDDVADTSETSIKSAEETGVKDNKPAEQTATIADTITTQPVQKQDLVDLLGWFEQGCGFAKYITDAEPVPSATDQRYDKFKRTFMTSRYNSKNQHIATVTPDYQLPKAYRNAVKDITVEQDDDGTNGVSYYVHFNNATYRGYDLDKLEIFYKPQSDYLYDVLHFKNTDFMALQPQFKNVYMEDSDWDRGGAFDADARTIHCELGY